MVRDPNLYDYVSYRSRPKIVWPGGKKLAFWVAPNVEYYELDPPNNPSRKPWPRPNPDIVPASLRDYGNRVGIWRLFDAMDEFGVRGSVSLSIAMLDHYPRIIEACVARNWEFLSHGVYNTRYSYGLSEEQERSLIEDTVRSVRQATGQEIRGYLAPALTHTENTMNLLAELGLWYTCDLFQDDQPQPLKVKTGRLISLPYSLEINDTLTYGTYMQSPRAYGDVLKRQFDQLLAEGEENGTVMCIPLHPYQVSHPHRIGPFRDALAHIAAHRDDVWVTTANEIAEFYLANCYDDAVADLQRRGLARPGFGFGPANP